MVPIYNVFNVDTPIYKQQLKLQSYRYMPYIRHAASNRISFDIGIWTSISFDAATGSTQIMPSCYVLGFDLGDNQTHIIAATLPIYRG